MFDVNSCDLFPIDIEQQHSIQYNDSVGCEHEQEHDIINQFIMCVDGALALVFNAYLLRFNCI